MSLYKKWHLIGLELGVPLQPSACAASRPASPPPSRATSPPPSPSAISKPAKCSTVKAAPLFRGLRPAEISVKGRYLPFAHHVKLKHAVKDGQPVTYGDVELDETTAAVKLRREMEAALPTGNFHKPGPHDHAPNKRTLNVLFAHVAYEFDAPFKARQQHGHVFDVVS
ncbi:MAG: hypothetical protein R3D67_00895 [Hyphomicrobiaceae bacterium]